jgi:hypothetical protein
MSIVDQKNRGYALGVADYLVKPVDRTKLLETLTNICGSGGCGIRSSGGRRGVRAVDPGGGRRRNRARSCRTASGKGDPALASIPVVLMSIVDQKNRGYALGAADYLVKPVDRTKLLETLTNICGSTAGRALLVDDDEVVRRGVRNCYEQSSPENQSATCHDKKWEPGSGTEVNDGAVEARPRRRVTGVACLHPDRPPNDVPRPRWRQFVDDCKSFLSSPEKWAELGAGLGWDAMALFGCAPKRPLDYLGSAGLLWAINGGRLLELHRDWAVIDIPVHGSCLVPFL